MYIQIDTIVSANVKRHLFLSLDAVDDVKYRSVICWSCVVFAGHCNACRVCGRRAGNTRDRPLLTSVLRHNPTKHRAALNLITKIHCPTTQQLPAYNQIDYGINKADKSPLTDLALVAVRMEALVHGDDAHCFVAAARRHDRLIAHAAARRELPVRTHTHTPHCTHAG